jgi:hypothetical protein
VSQTAGKDAIMPSILSDLPFFGELTTARLPDGTMVPVFADQIIIWASITIPDALGVTRARRFPAVLDTGFTNTFLIAERQLLSWAGLRRAELGRIDNFQTGGRRVPMYEADVYIHPNRPGTRDEFADRDPIRLDLEDGVGVWPSGIPGARRLPLLGVRAIRQAGLRAVVNGRRRRVWLGTPWRFWPFA